MEFIADYLSTYFDEITPVDFYRKIFREGELAEQGIQEVGKYCGIAVEITNRMRSNGKPVIRRYNITNGLEQIPMLLESENFIIISPISYAGKSRVSDNARFIYGIGIDVDGIDTKQKLIDLLHQMREIEFLPLATYIVSSGTGVHLYYLFDEPIPCFSNITKAMSKLKKALTKKIWNAYVTSLTDSIQYESLFQGFRMVGGVTKSGNRTRAFELGKRVSLEYLNKFVNEEDRVQEFTYKSKLTKEQAKQKYPNWYERRIENNQRKGTWTCKKDLYYWWKRTILSGATVGHRYYCLMCLAVYAMKSGISREELENDSFELLEFMESLTVDPDNHFTESDVLQALEMYNDSYFTFPRDTIAELSDIQIPANKRNYRKRNVHLERARYVQKFDYPNGEWRNKDGRPNKKKQVEEWKKAHPNGTITDCAKEMELSRTTVYKYWEWKDELS